jgi:hypothetical protein
MALSDLLQGCFNKSDTVMIYITRMFQGWRHKVVTILLYHDYIGLVGTTLQQVWQYQQGCYKLLFQTCWQLVTCSATDNLLTNLLQDVRLYILRVWNSGFSSLIRVATWFVCNHSHGIQRTKRCSPFPKYPGNEVVRHVGWYLHCKQAKSFLNVIRHGDGLTCTPPITQIQL